MDHRQDFSTKVSLTAVILSYQKSENEKSALFLAGPVFFIVWKYALRAELPRGR
jgi:hypothetical protein